MLISFVKIVLNLYIKMYQLIHHLFIISLIYVSISNFNFSNSSSKSITTPLSALSVSTSKGFLNLADYSFWILDSAFRLSYKE